MTDLTVRLILNADGSAVRTEVVGASQALDTFAQKAEASGVRVERTAVQAEQAVRRIGTTAVTAGAQVEAAMVGRASPALARLRQNFGQIGFQVGDFITQVQGGGNAFTAFAQQGGQLAGALAGGLAGLVVQIAAVGAQLLFAGSSTDQAARSTRSYNDLLRLSNELTGEAADAAKRLAEEKKREAVETARNALALAEEALARRNAALEEQAGRLRDPATAALVTGTAELETTLRARAADQIAALRRAVDEARVTFAELTRSPDGGGAGGGGRGAAARSREDFDPFKRLREAGRALEQELRTPLERYGDTVQRLQTLFDLGLENGGISAETYTRALTRANEELERAQRSAEGAASGVTGLEAAFGQLSQEIAGTGRETAKMLADALLGIERLDGGVAALLQRFASGVLQKLIYDQMTAPLAQAAGVLLRSGLSSLLGVFSGPSPGAIPGPPIIPVTATPLHAGGIVGREGQAPRVVPTSLFDGAPRLHSGGYIGSDEVPAILRRGEGVFTPEQMSALGPAGNTTVIINDMRSAGAPPIETSERRGPDGRRIIEMMIKESVNRGIADGSFDQTMGMAYGVSRAGMR